MIGTSSLKVLIASIIKNFRNFGMERDTTKKRDQNARSLEDLAILFRPYMTYLSPFQSYGGLKDLERSILLRLIVLEISMKHTNVKSYICIQLLQSSRRPPFENWSIIHTKRALLGISGNKTQLDKPMQGAIQQFFPLTLFPSFSRH